MGNLDKPVFKAPRQFTRLRELSRVHMTLFGDVVRVQARIKSLYRSRGVLVTGLDVYSPRRRDEWQKQLCSSAQTRAARRGPGVLPEKTEKTRRGPEATRERSRILI